MEETNRNSNRNKHAGRSQKKGKGGKRVIYSSGKQK
jgi:hypothetical protein